MICGWYSLFIYLPQINISLPAMYLVQTLIATSNIHFGLSFILFYNIYIYFKHPLPLGSILCTMYTSSVNIKSWNKMSYILSFFNLRLMHILCIPFLVEEIQWHSFDSAWNASYLVLCIYQTNRYHLTSTVTPFLLRTHQVFTVKSTLSFISHYKLIVLFYLK